jgi:hypothetical protein
MIRKLSQLKSLFFQAVLLLGCAFAMSLSASVAMPTAIHAGGDSPEEAQRKQQEEAANLDTGGTGGVCGGPEQRQVKTMIDIGCRGRGNPILDFLFAVIRVLSIGVGIVVIGSIIFAGIQYVTSAGDPQNTAKAIERIRNTVIALVLYLFTYALLNWLIPAGLLQG